jgi:phenylalanyl-tRNA synthetase beta chain
MVARVAMGPSPEWMQRRLTLAGMRPISNVVDVTNYVMLERCRPLHAFDLGRLPGRGIVVRLAEAGETLTTLDDVERKLEPDDLLICDAQRAPQAIAGIMGGAEAEVSDATTEILLESAYFAPAGIAATSKRLGLRSEASARFERGIDPNGTGTGAQRAMELFAEVAAAAPAGGAIDVYPTPVERPRIVVRTDRVNQLLGTSLTAGDIETLLEPLGIDVTDHTAVAPTFRPDLEREIDLVEEVARRIGLARIPRSVPSNPQKVGMLTETQRARRVVGDVLVGAGFDEIYTLPLLAPADVERAGISTAEAIEVENPLRAEESLLRPALLPGVLRAVAFNAAHGQPDVALFEVGTVFTPASAGATLPTEQLHLAFARSHFVVRTPHEADRPVALRDLTAVVDALAQELRLVDCRLEAASVAGLHPVRTAQVVVDGESIGAIGEVAPEVVDALALPDPVIVAELDVDRLLAARRAPRASRPVSRFPASTIDLAFVVADDVPAEELRRTLREAGGDMLEDVRLFDVFRSDTMGAGRVSLAFALRFRAPDRTLTDDDVGALRQSCIDAVVKAHGAELRA